MSTPTEVLSKLPPQGQKSYEEALFGQVESKLPYDEIRLFNTLVTQRRNKRPQIKDFNYSEQEKQQDLFLLQQDQAKAKRNTDLEKLFYTRAKIFEALLSEIMQHDWFPGFFLTETSEFDDWINGVDAVLESQSQGNRAAIIDFTSHKDKQKLREKINRILQKIERGELGQVKYFKSQIDGQTHHLKMLPMVIIGLDSRTLTEIIDIYAAQSKRELANHWVKNAIVEELLKQVAAFQKYINNSNRRGYNPASAQKMHQAYEDFKKMVLELKQKISQGEEMDTRIRNSLSTKDPVYKELTESLVF